MVNPLQTFDWSLIQSFLAVAEAGSLSAAARNLGTSQPTIGRRIHELERSLGASLFRRQSQGMSLTAQGQVLIAPARAMRDAAQALGVAAAGQDLAFAGTVRITASVFMSLHTLPPILADLQRAEPEIRIELVPTDETRTLLFREADIALRMYRPTQLDVITRRLGEIPIGIFGATAYLDRAGRPKIRTDLMRHRFVGYDRDDQIVAGFRAAGFMVDRNWFPMRCDDNVAYWALVRAGCGLGFGQRRIGLADPLVEEIPLDLDIPPMEVWLTAHEQIRQTPRIRRVWDHLADSLSDVVS